MLLKVESLAYPGSYVISDTWFSKQEFIYNTKFSDPNAVDFLLNYQEYLVC